jgi:acetyltransferase
VTLVTNGGGAGVLAADAAAAVGLPLARLSDELLAQLGTALPANWSRANPVDIIGDAPVERYVHTLSTLLAEPSTGTLLFMHAPTAIVPSLAIAEALRPLAEAHPGRIVACWLGDAAVADARRCFMDAGIACHDTPEQAVQALAAVALYRANQEQLLEAPALDAGAPASDRALVQGIVSDALASGREWLDASEAQRLLQAIGIAVPEVRVVDAQPRAAAAAAAQLGFPVALKIRSAQITHKSDVGGVVLGLNNAKAVTEAARQMLARVAAERPQAVVEGFSVQRMVQRPGAIELIAGTAIDPLFGPVVLFGAGGTQVEVLRDSAVALPPLNEPLARALVARTRISRLLAGWRDVPPADTQALHGVLLALAQLLADEPRITELDINPLLADAHGVIALDARVRLSAAAPGGAARFAIRPWPAEWVESFAWHFGGRTQTVTLRPIRPEDEWRHREFLERVHPEDIRLRIFYARKSIERSELARLVQIDYEREMAFVATLFNEAGVEETLAAVRTVADPDNHAAEFGILVRSDLKGGGLGRRLMEKIIAYQRSRGTRLLVATVLAENSGMLRLGAALGMHETADPHEPGVRRLELDLQADASVVASAPA